MAEIQEKSNINLDKIFVIFLALHVIIWSVLSLIRQVLPIDAAECVYWGSLLDFGTNKHPPLAGWIAYFVYNILGKSDFSIYLLGQASIITGFIYLYKLGKLFLNKNAALLAVMLLETCFVYTYMGIYDGFNPNFLLLAFLPMITFYFYKSVHKGELLDWIKLGIFTGLSFLAKYQTIMLFLPLFVYLIISPIGRKQFKKKGLYIAAIIAFLIVLPHIIWLFKHNFFSLNYFITCEDRYAGFYYGPLKYIWSPLVFLFNQIITIVPLIFIYFTAIWFSKEKLCKNNLNPENKKFLICAGIAPIFLQSLNGFSGNYMIPQWGYSLLFISGILLFGYFPYKLTDKAIKYILSWIFTAMFITFIILAIIFTTEKNFANRFPVQQVTNTLNEIYKTETGQDMKYIGGFIELSIPLSLYNQGKYIAVLNTYGHPNIWIDSSDLKKSGAIVVGRKIQYMDDYVDMTMPELPEKPKIRPFYFTVKNSFGSDRKYLMFYSIIPPNIKF